MIKCAIFDIDGTLYDYNTAHSAAFKALTDYASDNLGISEEEFAALHKKKFKEGRETMGDVAAIHNRLIRYQKILEELSLPLSPHLLNMYNTYWETFLDNSAEYPGATKTLRQLKSAGITTGIGTDMTAWMQVRKLELMGMLPYIDFIVTSEEACAEKPSGKFFELCIKKSGYAADQCLFIGDSFNKDVRGALENGIHALWFCPDGNYVSHTEAEFITSFSEIPGWIHTHL